MPATSQPAKLLRISDGDTLKLVGGTSVRLLGLNTPELARSGRAAQPLAQEASEALRSLLSEQLFLVDGDQPQDRYGRRLSHVFSSSGRSAEEVLLEKGLGFFVGSDPTTGMADCLRLAEQRARQAKRGVWSERYWAPMAFDSPQLRAGFVVLQGRIERVERSRKATWIETEGDVVLRVDDGERHRFPADWWQQIEGQRVLVKAWMVDRDGRQGKHKRWLVRLMYPDMLIPLN